MKAIDMNGTYCFRNKSPARILCIDSGAKSWPVIALCVSSFGVVSITRHDAYGKVKPSGYYDDDDEFDLLEASEFDNFKIDDKVLVWNDTKDQTSVPLQFKQLRYFANVDSDGKASTFADGATSWSAEYEHSVHQTESWDYCELFDESVADESVAEVDPVKKSVADSINAALELISINISDLDLDRLIKCIDDMNSIDIDIIPDLG